MIHEARESIRHKEKEVLSDKRNIRSNEEFIKERKAALEKQSDVDYESRDYLSRREFQLKLDKSSLERNTKKLKQARETLSVCQRTGLFGDKPLLECELMVKHQMSAKEASEVAKLLQQFRG